MEWQKIETPQTTKKQRQYLHLNHKDKPEWDRFVRWLSKQDADQLQDMLYRYYTQQIYEFQGAATD